MRFNVAQLLKSPAGASREYNLDEDIAGIDPDLDALKPVTGKVRFLRTNDGILVTGHVRTEVRVPCRRCLLPASVPVELDLEEEFRPSIDILTGQRGRSQMVKMRLPERTRTIFWTLQRWCVRSCYWPCPCRLYALPTARVFAQTVVQT